MDIKRPPDLSRPHQPNGMNPGPVPRRTRVIYTETLSNPTLVVADIPRLAELAQAKARRDRAWRACKCLQTLSAAAEHNLSPTCLKRPQCLVHQSCSSLLPAMQGLKLVVDNTFTPMVLSPIR